MLNDKEVLLVKQLRIPQFYMVKKVFKPINLNEFSNDEILELYDKMDEYIEAEGQQRRALGSYDEMYIIELLNVKDKLLKEINIRKEN